MVTGDDESSYEDDWGGPSLVGVVAGHLPTGRHSRRAMIWGDGDFAETPSANHAANAPEHRPGTPAGWSLPNVLERCSCAGCPTTQALGLLTGQSGQLANESTEVTPNAD